MLLVKEMFFLLSHEVYIHWIKKNNNSLLDHFPVSLVFPTGWIFLGKLRAPKCHVSHSGT